MSFVSATQTNYTTMKTNLKALLVFALVLTGITSHAQKLKSIPEDEMKKKVIKFEFFSPLTGNATLGYETYLKNFTSLEFKVGLIGAGVQDHSTGKKETGLFISGGPKFKLKPAYAVDGMYSTHVLRGGYIRPELSFGTFNVERYDYYYNNSSLDENATFVSFTINYGQQYILGDSFSLDWYFGLGYGYSTEDDLGYYYRNIFGSNEFPIALNGGFTIGILLK